MYGRNQADHGLLCTPDLVYCFFEFVSYTFEKESVKYMNFEKQYCLRTGLSRSTKLWNPVHIMSSTAGRIS